MLAYQAGPHLARSSTNRSTKTLGPAPGPWYDTYMTNNTDTQTLSFKNHMIAFLEKELFARNAVITLHQTQLHRWAQDEDMAERLPELDAQVQIEKAARDAVNVCLQEAKAKAEELEGPDIKDIARQAAMVRNDLYEASMNDYSMDSIDRADRAKATMQVELAKRGLTLAEVTRWDADKGLWVATR